MTDDRPSNPASAASPMAMTTAVSTDDEAIVASFDTVMEAELARGRLESEGIGARIVDGNTVGVAQHLSIALGGVKIAVSRSEFEAAREVLNAPPLSDEELAMVALPPEAERVVVKVDALDADGYANRALRAAVIGLVALPPLGQLWSLVMLAKAVSVDGPILSPKGKTQATIAVTIDAAVIGFAAFVISKLF
jgi:hypothetical protein